MIANEVQEENTQFSVFPEEYVKFDLPPEKSYQEVAKKIHATIGIALMESLKGRDLTVVPGEQNNGGLLFTIPLMPVDNNGGGRIKEDTPMAVLVSMNDLGILNVSVREIASGDLHYATVGVYFEELQRFIASLDYDGRDFVDPKLWDDDESEYGVFVMSPEDLYEATHWSSEDY